MIAVACLYFMLMLVYAIIAECCNLPMPLDDRYLIGKINGIIMLILMVGGLVFFIIQRLTKFLGSVIIKKKQERQQNEFIISIHYLKHHQRGITNN